MRKLILYGASKTGKLALNYYGDENVQYFCDSDVSKHGLKFYEKEVISVYRLKEIVDDYTIIITSHKCEEIGTQLLSCGIKEFDVFYPKQMYLYGWLLQIKNSIDLNKFSLNDKSDLGLLKKVKNNKKSKITICFTYICYAYWNANQTLYQACVDDSRFQVQVLFIKSAMLDLKLERDDRVEWYQEEEYDPLNEELNYIVFNIPDWRYSEKLKISYLRKKKSIKIVVLHANILFFGTGENAIKNYISFPLYHEADYLFVHKNYYGLKNAIEVDNPKMDMILNKINNTKSINKNWEEKINGRKVVLWNTTHGAFGEGIPALLFSFHIWYEHMLRIFELNKDLVLIFRPHPHMFSELIANRICTSYEVKQFREYFEQSDNLIWDDTKDYVNAFNASDVLFSDWSGLLVTYLATKKPIVFLEPKHIKEAVIDEGLMQGFYQVNTEQGLREIIQMISEGKDTMKEKRMQIMNDFIKYRDGKNGERLKQLLYNEWVKVEEEH